MGPGLEVQAASIQLQRSPPFPRPPARQLPWRGRWRWPRCRRGGPGCRWPAAGGADRFAVVRRSRGSGCRDTVGVVRAGFW